MEKLLDGIPEWLQTTGEVLVAILGFLLTYVFGVDKYLFKDKREREKSLRQRLGGINASKVDPAEIEAALNRYLDPGYTTHPPTSHLPHPEAEDHQENLFEHLIQLLEGRTPPNPIQVLGETGMGKTTLLYRLHKRYEYYKPYQLNRKHGGKSKKYYVRYLKVAGLTEQQIQEVAKDVDQELKKHNTGAKERLLLLLDALDEDLENGHRVEERTNEVIGWARDCAKAVVLTARVQYFEPGDEFENQQDYLENLGAQDWHRFFLTDFTADQVKHYLKRFKGKEKKIAEEFVTRMGAQARRPLMLSYLPEFVKDQAAPNPAQYRFLHLRVELYRVIIDKMLKREITKLPQLKTVAVKQTFQRNSKRFYAAIAQALWQQKQIGQGLLQTQVEDLAKEFEVEDLFRQILADADESSIKRQEKVRSLLTRRGDRWDFTHRSFTDFFLAEQMAKGGLFYVPHPEEPFLHPSWKNLADKTAIGYDATSEVLAFYNSRAWKDYFIEPLEQKNILRLPYDPYPKDPSDPNLRSDTLPHNQAFPRDLPQLYWQVARGEQGGIDLQKIFKQVLPEGRSSLHYPLQRAFQAMPDPIHRAWFLAKQGNLTDYALKSPWQHLKLALLVLDPDLAPAFTDLPANVAVAKEWEPAEVASAEVKIYNYSLIATCMHEQGTTELHTQQLESLPLNREADPTLPIKPFIMKHLPLLAAVNPKIAPKKQTAPNQLIWHFRPPFQAVIMQWARLEGRLAKDHAMTLHAEESAIPFWTEWLTTEPAYRAWQQRRSQLEKSYGYTDGYWGIGDRKEGSKPGEAGALSQPWSQRRWLYPFTPQLIGSRWDMLGTCHARWQKLHLQAQGIERLTGMEYLADSLEVLQLDHNPITDVEPLRAFHCLEELSLLACELDHFPWDGDWPNLRRLALGRNPGLSVEGNAMNAPQLEELDLSQTALTSLVGLPTTLKKLKVSDTPLESLAGLEALVQLEHLEADGLKVADWQPLLACTRLHTLVIRRGNRPSPALLKQMSGLRQLLLRENLDLRAELPQLKSIGMGRAYFLLNEADPPAPPSGFVQVPGGIYLRGSDEALTDDAAYTPELPQQEVAVAAFWLQQYLITRADFHAFIKATAYRTTAEQLGGSFTVYGFMDDIDWRFDHLGREWRSEGEGTWQKPVAHVSWYDACRYANWLNEQGGLKPCYQFGQFEVEINPAGDKKTVQGVIGFTDTGGYRLPTEAEWEYAAGWAPQGARHRFAGTSDEKALADLAHFNDVMSGTIPVGQRQPNALGLYDMSGNVYEWCHSPFASYGAFLHIDDLEESFWTDQDWAFERDDNQRQLISMRTLKGGFFGSVNKMMLRVANRGHDYPHFHLSLVGFRLARTLPS